MNTETDKIELSDAYLCCMIIGNRFQKAYSDIASEEEWSASEECSTIAYLTYELVSTLNMSVECALDYIFEIAINSGFRKVEDHMWDDFCKGFLAGEILGLPTKDNVESAKMVEYLWHNDIGKDGEHKYGYYQEVLEEVKGE